MCVASRLGRRPKRLKEMQLAVAAAVDGGSNMSTPSCSSDQHLETSSVSVRRLSMSSSTIHSSLDVGDVHAELQVHSFIAVLLHCTRMCNTPNDRKYLSKQEWLCNPGHLKI